MCSEGCEWLFHAGFSKDNTRAAEVIVCEALATRDALAFAIDIGLSKMVLEMDSSMVINANKNSDRELSELGGICADIKRLDQTLQHFEVQHIPKGCNKVAHILARKALDLSNMIPAEGTAIEGKGVIICKYPNDPTVALGSLSVVSLLISAFLGVVSVFFPYKGQSVPKRELFRNTALAIFFAIAGSSCSTTTMLYDTNGQNHDNHTEKSHVSGVSSESYLPHIHDLFAIHY
ncbi:uncharacterized protein A4U43_C05F4050 [Asparagus officinalis]|uniref:RNase H type-1 domain-containing protein n=1 Tax=Asparagus officinalis TaxID=4686 RepID=A0A5P1EQ85_ASPOF|nr:uncharacterized protein A4U43_C05F4050 [Asparagus officinalis]